MNKLLLPLLLLLFNFGTIRCQINLIWNAEHNGEGDFNDKFICSARDAQGNIYAAGSTVNQGQDRDILVTKLDQNGTFVWRKTINGSASGPDEIQSIALDSMGNILVTGFIKNDLTTQDIVTIKYNTNGDTLWLKSYDFISEYDQGNSIQLDNAGNVYVTGQSDSDPSAFLNDDYVTIKYDSNGNTLWVQRFNGPGNAIDRSVKIILDNFGGIYITGRSNNGIDDDYVTIKYDNLGNQQWIRFDDRGGRDRATGLAICIPGNKIYITGKSDNGNNYDYWTLCYDFNGILLWDQPFDFVEDDNAIAITADALGNCYVTGESDADPSPILNYDFQTVAYDSTGNQLWQSRFAGLAGNDDSPNDLCIINSALYVLGNQDSDPTSIQNKKLTLVSYNRFNGTSNWNTSFAPVPYLKSDAYAVLQDGDGAIAVGYLDGPVQQKNAVVVRFGPSGAITWNYIFNGIGDNNDNIRSIAVDNNYSIYAAGYLTENNSNRNFALVKFNSSGNVLCSRTIDGNSVGSIDDAQGIIIDNTGNPVLAGFTKNKTSSNDLQISSYNSLLCDTLWTETIDGIGHGSDKLYDIFKDNSGLIYVTGRQDFDVTNASNDNCYTAKLNANGTLVWQQYYNSSGSNEDRGISVKASSTGNVYVTGRSWNGLDYDIFLIKYNSNGIQQWVQTYHGGFGDDEPKELVIDANENILISGKSEELIDSVYDYVVLKYSSSGILSWSYKYNGIGSGNDFSSGLSVDFQGNIAVVGQSDQDPSQSINYDMVVIYLNSSGALQWSYSYNGPSNLDDIGDDIQFNNFGQIYTTGHFNKGSNNYPNYDIITMILHPNGGLLWSDTFNGSSDSSDIPNLIYLNNNDFYIAGSTVNSNQMRNMLLLKYSGTVGINFSPINQKVLIYPNPFDCQINIDIPEILVNSKIEILELSGRILFEGTASEEHSTISLGNLKTGCYIYRIQGTNQEPIIGIIDKN